MKIGAGMKLISEGWIQKPKGFRVKYEKIVNSEKVVEYSPDQNDAPLDSDVTTWRYAWKLFKATEAGSSTGEQEELFNVHVVDENEQPIVYYVTGRKEIFNPK
jgi:hypothetical protein